MFYCLAGHPQYFTESDEVKIKKLERQLANERASHDQTRADRDATERRRRAEKGAKTRIKNRVGRGVCPCCNRSFENLGRHMQSKHPEFMESEA